MDNKLTTLTILTTISVHHYIFIMLMIQVRRLIELLGFGHYSSALFRLKQKGNLGGLCADGESCAQTSGQCQFNTLLIS